MGMIFENFGQRTAQLEIGQLSGRHDYPMTELSLVPNLTVVDPFTREILFESDEPVWLLQVVTENDIGSDPAIYVFDDAETARSHARAFLESMGNTTWGN